jgi:hypothetical protein
MRSNRSPLKWLRAFDMQMVLLMISAVFLIKSEPVFYLLIFASGVIGGGQFAAANLSIEKAGSAAAGRLYAVDLAGSFLGSFLTAVFMVPLAGMRSTILFLVFMKAMSFVFLIRYKKV